MIMLVVPCLCRLNMYDEKTTPFSVFGSLVCDVNGKTAEQKSETKERWSQCVTMSK